MPSHDQDIFAQVVLAIDSVKMQDTYTYAIPKTMVNSVFEGSLVLIPVKNSLRRGIVVEITQQKPSVPYEIREIISVYGPGNILDQTGIETARWISTYFHSSLYSAIKLLFWDLKTFKIETSYRIPDTERFFTYVRETCGLFAKPQKQIKLDGSYTHRKMKSILKACQIYAGEQDELIDKLLAEGIIVPEYNLEKSKIRDEKVAYSQSDSPPVEISITSKEEEMLLAASDMGKPVTWDDLKDQFSGSRKVFSSLISKGFLTEVHHFETSDSFSESNTFTLNDEQQIAADEIIKSVKNESCDSFLLEGITGSGKTEVYIECAKEALKKGSVVVLVPEIVLTMQIVKRFKMHFGEELFVLHSGLGQSSLKRNWEILRGSEKRIVIGPRSALFAPLTDVKLIIIDEEHEPAYKQDRSPRYHARDVARKISALRKATLVLGSATPSVESRYLAESNKCGHLKLTQRIFSGGLPDVQVVKLSDSGAMAHQFLSAPLIDELNKVLDRKKQALLFINQRGFSPSVVCPSCGFTPTCSDCNISFTYHSRENMLLCHHCDRKIPLVTVCPSCGAKNLLKLGFGTQRIEQEISRLFPDASVYRLDRDVSQRSGLESGGQALMQRFFDEDGDILVGTQMIGKGLDLPDVELVGIISADTSLNLPDFRAAERTFQLITQVAGRAGRRETKGMVVLQSYKPGHYAVEAARMQDYESFYRKEIELRKRLQYPPFMNLARIVIKGRDEKIVEKQAQTAAEILSDFNRRKTTRLKGLIGPSSAPLGRIAGYYRYHMILKASKVSDLVDAITRLENRMNLHKGLRMEIDINPLNML